MEKVEAPFTAEQVANINEFQVSRRYHPFTCGGGGGPCSRVSLIAHEDSLRCPKCDYRQSWVWDIMAAKLSPRQQWKST